MLYRLNERAKELIAEKRIFMRPEGWEKIPPLSYYDVLGLLGKARDKIDRAMITVLFLTGARINEIVKALRPQDFRWREDTTNFKFLEAHIKTEKNMLEHFRSIPIAVADRDKMLWKTWAEAYVKALDPTEHLFPFSDVTAGKRLNKIEPELWAHRFRHSRLTELVNEYDFTGQQLVQFAGWTDERPAKTYIHQNPMTLVRRFKEHQGL